MTRMLLTPEEAAEALSLSRSKVYELLNRGVISSVTIDRSRRIPVASLQAFIASLVNATEVQA